MPDRPSELRGPNGQPLRLVRCGTPRPRAYQSCSPGQGGQETCPFQAISSDVPTYGRTLSHGALDRPGRCGCRDQCAQAPSGTCPPADGDDASQPRTRCPCQAQAILAIRAAPVALTHVRVARTAARSATTDLESQGPGQMGTSHSQSEQRRHCRSPGSC